MLSAGEDVEPLRGDNVNLRAHSQTLPKCNLIDRQHFELQQWLLHGNRNHNRHQYKAGHLGSSDTSHPAFHSFPFVMSTNPSRPNTFITHVCLLFLNFTSPLVFFVLLPSLSTVLCPPLSVPSLHPSLCWFISPLSILKEQGHAQLKLLCSMTYSSTSLFFF